MSDLENRIKKLEKRVDALENKELKRKTWVLVKGEPVPEGIGENDQVIEVENERTKELTEQILRGEGTE